MSGRANPCGKTRDVNDPYEIWIINDTNIGKIEYRVLKKYQLPEREKSNKYSRWFTAAKSPATFGSHEFGDMYVNSITDIGEKLEFKKEELKQW